MRWTKKLRFPGRSIRGKLILPVMFTLGICLSINLLLIARINGTIQNMDQVYGTNVQLEETKRILTNLEESIYEYLNVQNQDAFLKYTESSQAFEAIIAQIDDTITDQPTRAIERTFRRLGVTYLELADEAVKAKQSYDVETYKNNYGEISRIYEYLISYMEGLDALRFRTNSENYEILNLYLRYLEFFVTAVLIFAAGSMMLLLYLAIGSITRPLENLAQKAELVSQGNWDIPLEEPDSQDEVGTVTAAFNQMIASINGYVDKIRESLRLELEMKERELAMERLLKDAQLRYHQAQINPHFLFNTLNAGQQLAMMEDAERTYTFIDNMAQFFRYRLRKNGEGATLREEIELIDNYMYIMNVRYANEITIHKDIDPALLELRYPGMVLQPLVENALKHGLAGVEWEKVLWLSVIREGEEVVIRLRDNGVGMTPERLQEINGEEFHPERDSAVGNGVGVANVRERLRLFFGRQDVLTVESDGVGTGTLVVIRTPIWQAEDGSRKLCQEGGAEHV